MNPPVLATSTLCTLIACMSIAPRNLVVAAIYTVIYTLVMGSPFIAMGYLAIYFERKSNVKATPFGNTERWLAERQPSWRR